MKKIVVIELVKEGKKIGYAPVVEEKGEKPVMFTKGEEAVSFKTKKEARIYGLEQIQNLEA
jgi:hypothetical protein